MLDSRKEKSKFRNKEKQSERWMQRFIDPFMFRVFTNKFQEEIDEPLPPVTPHHKSTTKQKSLTKTKIQGDESVAQQI